jgi:hypothetical protein
MGPQGNPGQCPTTTRVAGEFTPSNGSVLDSLLPKMYSEVGASTVIDIVVLPFDASLEKFSVSGELRAAPVQDESYYFEALYYDLGSGGYQSAAYIELKFENGDPSLPFLEGEQTDLNISVAKGSHILLVAGTGNAVAEPLDFHANIVFKPYISEKNESDLVTVDSEI